MPGYNVCLHASTYMCFSQIAWIQKPNILCPRTINPTCLYSIWNYQRIKEQQQQPKKQQEKQKLHRWTHHQPTTPHNKPLCNVDSPNLFLCFQFLTLPHSIANLSRLLINLGYSYFGMQKSVEKRNKQGMRTGTLNSIPHLSSRAVVLWILMRTHIRVHPLQTLSSSLCFSPPSKTSFFIFLCSAAMK